MFPLAVFNSSSSPIFYPILFFFLHVFAHMMYICFSTHVPRAAYKGGHVSFSFWDCVTYISGLTVGETLSPVLNIAQASSGHVYPERRVYASK